MCRVYIYMGIYLYTIYIYIQYIYIHSIYYIGYIIHYITLQYFYTFYIYIDSIYIYTHDWVFQTLLGPLPNWDAPTIVVHCSPKSVSTLRGSYVSS